MGRQTVKPAIATKRYSATIMGGGYGGQGKPLGGASPLSAQSRTFSSLVGFSAWVSPVPQGSQEAPWITNGTPGTARRSDLPGFSPFKGFIAQLMSWLVFSFSYKQPNWNRSHVHRVIHNSESVANSYWVLYMCQTLSKHFNHINFILTIALWNMHNYDFHFIDGKSEAWDNLFSGRSGNRT